jgi:ApaG protein
MQNKFIEDDEQSVDANNTIEVFNTAHKAHIDVYIEAHYIQNQSKIGQYAFSYKVYLENVGDIASQIIARHWIITDSNGEIREIKGLGIVGEQPTLQPGQKHEYSSLTILSTPVGTMKGTYLCITEAGDLFGASIPEFILSLPNVLH